MKMAALLATMIILTFVAATGNSVGQERVPQQERGAPAEKVAPPKQRSARQHQNGEVQKAPAGRSEWPNGRVGQAPQHRGRAETTGQAPRSSDRDAGQERAQTEQRLE